MNKLAILIPRLVERRALGDRLITALNYQREKLNLSADEFIIIENEDNREKTTGKKRNELIDEAVRQACTHIAFFDDDDLPGKNYVKLQMEVANSDKDCGTLWGMYYSNGVKDRPFEHSLKYTYAFEDKDYFYRAPNHLNVMKLDLIKDVRFQDKSWGEDGCFMEDIQKRGLLKTEYEINEIIYHYLSGKKGTEIETQIFNEIMQ